MEALYLRGRSGLELAYMLIMLALATCNVALEDLLQIVQLGVSRNRLELGVELAYMLKKVLLATWPSDVILAMSLQSANSN